MESTHDWRVIFDLGRVLFQWEPQQIVAQLYAEPRLRSTIRQAVFEHPDWQEMDRGMLTEAAAIDRFRQRTDRPAAELRRLMQVAWASLTPIAETWRLVEELAERQIPLYCLSNIASSTFADLKKRYDCWDVFRGIVISGEVRMIKPERAIFEHTRDRYGLTPSRTVFVDDTAANVAAAKEVGFQTVLFTGAATCRSELAAILGN
jgi:putative hydrolase of the HAD superfamily